MKRTLVLKREALTELGTDELGSVVGGTTPISRTCALLTFVPCYVVASVLEGCVP